MCFFLLREIIGFTLVKVKREKLYGKYSHNLLVHAPLQFQIIDGESVKCVGEERFFITIKSITKSTSLYHPSHIIGICIVRHQIETRTQDTYHHERTAQPNKIDECVHQDAASTVYTHEATESKTFKTFKINKTFTNVLNAITHSKNTKQKPTKLQTYEANLMKTNFNGTPSKRVSYDFYETKKKRGENIPIKTILDILRTKTAITVTKLKKENQSWKREFIASYNLCAPTVTDPKSDKTIAQKLKQIKIGTHLLHKYFKILKTQGMSKICANKIFFV